MNIINDKIKEGSWLDIHSTKFENLGKEGTWTWVSRKGNTPAVVIAAIILDDDNRTPFKNNKLIVTKEYRIPLFGYEYALPAGLMDKDESIEETTKRELLEETGYSVKNIISISPFVYSSSGLTNESISIVMVEVDKNKRESQRLESTEDITVFSLNKREIRELMNKAKQKQIMISAKAWLIYDHFSRYNFL